MPQEQPQPGTPPVPAPAAEPEPTRPPVAWQPFTPRGVAAFAQGGAGWLGLLQMVVALLSAGTVVWFLSTAWFPEVRTAIEHLPDQGVIADQQLLTPLPRLATLAEGPLLGFVVDQDDLKEAIAASDVRVEFHETRLVIASLFGSLAFPYPRGWTIEFNRTELEPWWGAWEPILRGLAAVAVLILLPLVWAVLATVYCPLVRGFGYVLDRQLTWAGSWKLSAAALIPGALLMNAALVLYGLGGLDLLRLLILVAAHLALPWLYLIGGTMALPPRHEIPDEVNPFAKPAAEEKSPAPNSEPNPKSEIRNPNEIRNPKSEEPNSSGEAPAD
jgi:hypothetical protein